MRKRALFVGLTVSILAAGVALAMGLLYLPLDPVTVIHGQWLDPNNPLSTLEITLEGVPDGYDVSDGTYVGWCIEDNFLNDPPEGLYRLVDSTDSPANFPNPCENYAGIPWNKVNYLLNHKIGGKWDVQLALWVVAGTDSGRTLSEDAETMITQANALGGNFVPGVGDVVAVAVCADGIDVWPDTPPGMYQDTIFEVPFDGDGCTPGYWKQRHHYDSWPDAYDPEDRFDVVFGVVGLGQYSDISLGDALKKGGGGEKALLRHATAALLNATNGDVYYPYTEAEVIALVQYAYGPDGDFEDAKDLLEHANELGCPLN
jgi:hypothetical protein